MKFVSLASDHAPTYAALLPIAARIWREMGYVPIVQTSLDETRSFDRVVLEHLPPDARIRRIDARTPMSLANTMRAARLHGFHQVDHDDDVVVTADADWFPLSRTYYELPAPLCALNVQWYCAERSELMDPERFEPHDPARWRFPMSCFAAPRKVWAELFPSGDDWPIAGDDPSWDESALTVRVLRRSEGDPLVALSHGHWTKGDLHLVEPLDAPHLSMYVQGVGRGFLGPYDAQRALEFPEGALHLVPPRVIERIFPRWMLGVVRNYWPELRTWVDSYERAIGPAVWEALAEKEEMT